jgi:hypothetical protein
LGILSDIFFACNADKSRPFYSFRMLAAYNSIFQVRLTYERNSISSRSARYSSVWPVDGRVGRQEKWIVVTTDWVPPQPTTLRFTVNVPEVITIQPELVWWRVGDQLNPKTIRIAVPDGIPAKVISVQADNTAVKLELSEIRPGKELEVKVTPTTTSQPTSATLLIRTDYPPQNPATRYVYARVK